MFVWLIVLLLLFLYIAFDVHYLVRIVLSIVVGKFLRKKISIEESSEVYGIVLPSDGDVLLTHMNNSRYLREFDFARFDHAARTGLLDYVLKKGGNIPVSAFHMRYRLPAMTFSPFKVLSRIVYWDSKFIYVDQRLITLKDNIVRGAGYAKVACVKFDGEETITKLFPKVAKPEIPADLKKWNEACELSSEMMKKEK